jgi:hypothetical protein
MIGKVQKLCVFGGPNTDILGNQQPKKDLSIPAFHFAFLLAPVFSLSSYSTIKKQMIIN